MPEGRFFPAAFGSNAAGRIFLSPLQYALDGTDALRIVGANSAAGIAITLAGYRIDETGNKHPFEHTLTPPSTRLPFQQDFPLGAGALLNVTSYVSSGSSVVGQTFIAVHLVRGSTGGTVLLGTLLSGYVTPNQAMAWPGSPLMRSTDGSGFTRRVTASAPAVGVDIQHFAPVNTRWRVQSFRATLVTSAAAGNRFPVFEVRDPTLASVLLDVPANIGQTAGTTLAYTWAQGLNALAVAARVVQAIPHGLILPVSSAIQTLTVGLLGGDQWSSSELVVEEWIDLP